RLGRKPRAIVAERLTQLEVAGIESFGQVRGGEACHAVADLFLVEEGDALAGSLQQTRCGDARDPAADDADVHGGIAGQRWETRIGNRPKPEGFRRFPHGASLSQKPGAAPTRTAPPPHGSGEGKPAAQLVLQRQGPQGCPPSPGFSLHARVVPSAARWQVPGPPPPEWLGRRFAIVCICEERHDRVMRIEPFKIEIDAAVLADLRLRILNTRWPDQVPGTRWDQGTDLDYLKRILAYWADGFDWPAQQRKLNEVHHFRADLDGVHIHFVHEKARRGRGLPLILTH